MKDRTTSSVAPRASGLTRTHAAVGIATAAGVAVGWILLHTPGKKQAQGEDLRVQSVAQYTPAPAPSRMTPVPVSMPIVAPPPMAVIPPPAPAEQRQVQDPMRAARHAPLIAFSGASQPAPAAGAGDATPPASRGGAPSELAAKLVPTQVTSVTATVLKNQPYLITRGTQIQCVLLTAIDSTLPGPISCRLPFDVIGKTGLTLLDRGSIVVGETGGSMQQGQKRLFALWSRAETPQGVVVNLDSPGADPLGRAGFEGSVENYFLERVGNALLLSVVQGGMQVAASSVAPQGSTQLNFGGTESAVSEALRGSVNIRPTLRMNQGDLISISVIRDIDFKPVYQLGLR